MGRWVAILALALGTPLAAFPQDVSAPSPEDALPLSIDEVNDCIARNTPTEPLVQTIEVRARDRIGSERVLRAKIWWKVFPDGFSRVLATFSEPEDISGSGFLMIEQAERTQMFLYMPELDKVRRITSQMMKGKMFGTDFSYEDFERLHGEAGKDDLSRLPDSELDGVPVYVMEGRAPPELGSAYERSISFVDKRTCVPIKTDLYEVGGRLRKVLTTRPERLEGAEDIWLPRELLMVDLRDQTETTLVFQSIEMNANISSRLFRVDTLERTSKR